MVINSDLIKINLYKNNSKFTDLIPHFSDEYLYKMCGKYDNIYLDLHIIVRLIQLNKTKTVQRLLYCRSYFSSQDNLIITQQLIQTDNIELMLWLMQHTAFALPDVEYMLLYSYDLYINYRLLCPNIISWLLSQFNIKRPRRYPHLYQNILASDIITIKKFHMLWNMDLQPDLQTITHINSIDTIEYLLDHRINITIDHLIACLNNKYPHDIMVRLIEYYPHGSFYELGEYILINDRADILRHYHDKYNKSVVLYVLQKNISGLLKSGSSVWEYITELNILHRLSDKIRTAVYHIFWMAVPDMIEPGIVKFIYTLFPELFICPDDLLTMMIKGNLADVKLFESILSFINDVSHTAKLIDSKFNLDNNPYWVHCMSVIYNKNKTAVIDLDTPWLDIMLDHNVYVCKHDLHYYCWNGDLTNVKKWISLIHLTPHKK